VIKNTQAWRGAGGYEEYPKSTVLQMMVREGTGQGIRGRGSAAMQQHAPPRTHPVTHAHGAVQGRAGRPQFDDSGTVVIMTSMASRQTYLNLSTGMDAIESCLATSLIEHLAAEISLGTVTDVASAVAWLRSTFMFVRMCKNPRHYRLPAGATQPQVEEHLHAIVHTQAFALYRQRCLQLAVTPGASAEASYASASLGAHLRPTSLPDLKDKLQSALRAGGAVRLVPLSPIRVLVHSYLRFDTFALFSTIRRDASVAALLQTLCNAKELADSMVLRREERKVRHVLLAQRERASHHTATPSTASRLHRAAIFMMVRPSVYTAAPAHREREAGQDPGAARH